MVLPIQTQWAVFRARLSQHHYREQFDENIINWASIHVLKMTHQGKDLEVERFLKRRPKYKKFPFTKCVSLFKAFICNNY